MSFDFIDKLYDIYINEDETLASEVLMSAYLRNKKDEEKTAFLNQIKSYIASKMGNLPNYYSSKETENERDAFVLNLINSMVNLSSAMDHYRVEILQKADAEIESYNLTEEDYSSEFVPEEDDYLTDYISFNARQIDPELLFGDYDEFYDTIPQNLFFMGRESMELAYQKYRHKVPKLSQENFDQLQEFIEYVKSKDLISKVFVDNDIEKLSIDTVVSTLVDADKNIMKNFHFDPIPRSENEIESNFLLFDYFQYMKAGCDKIKDIDFKSYRSAFISKRGINADLDKIVFARNYLEFIRTGMMPSANGMLDLPVDAYELFKVEEDFLKLYNNKFKNDKFMKMQANYIFDIDNAMLYPDKFEKIKAVRNGKELSIGCLLSSRITIGNANYDDSYYLMHIHISDVTDDKSNYELQLNVLPAGSFKNRVQLVRFDNYGKDGTHKNVGNKLNTRTHIHLYNHFDLIRGKEFGEYDIAFNLEDESTDFGVALKVFLEFISSDKELYNTLLKKVSRVKAYAEEKARESEMVW